MFRQRHPAVEIMAVHSQQQFRQNCLGTIIQFADVIAVPCDDYEIRQLLQLIRVAIGFQQSNDVLAKIRARQGKDHRLFRLL